MARGRKPDPILQRLRTFIAAGRKAGRSVRSIATGAQFKGLAIPYFGADRLIDDALTDWARGQERSLLDAEGKRLIVSELQYSFDETGVVIVPTGRLYKEYSEVKVDPVRVAQLKMETLTRLEGIVRACPAFTPRQEQRLYAVIDEVRQERDGTNGA